MHLHRHYAFKKSGPTHRFQLHLMNFCELHYSGANFNHKPSKELVRIWKEAVLISPRYITAFLWRYGRTYEHHWEHLASRTGFEARMSATQTATVFWHRLCCRGWWGGVLCIRRVVQQRSETRQAPRSTRSTLRWHGQPLPWRLARWHRFRVGDRRF
jgi:hypothetical protein